MPDVNVLVNARREEAPDHAKCVEWLSQLVTAEEPFALSQLVLIGFVRVVTQHRVFSPPTTVENAFRFVQDLLDRPGCHLIRPGPRHWSIFRSLCETKDVRGPLVADAAHAALAIESGCEWVTGATDFARFAPPLRWTLL